MPLYSPWLEAFVSATASSCQVSRSIHSRRSPSLTYSASPSRYEGFPLVLLKALVLGIPIVASECGSELLGDGDYGHLVATGSVEDLANAVEWHLRAPERLRTMARQGPQRARRFAWSQIADDYRSFLADVPQQRVEDSGKDGQPRDRNREAAP